MSSKSGHERDDESNTVGTAADEDDQQIEKAAHLAERAGESVGRRYDVTKEVHHEERE